jgi:hypothetical protein
MAGIPLNTFKTVTFPSGDFAFDSTEKVVYIASTGITSIILSAQAATVGSNQGKVTFKHYRPAPNSNPVVGSPPGGLDAATVIVNQAVVPPNDALVLLGGKLVLETFDYITLQASADLTLNFVASILETANQ